MQTKECLLQKKKQNMGVRKLDEAKCQIQLSKYKNCKSKLPYHGIKQQLFESIKWLSEKTHIMDKKTSFHIKYIEIIKNRKIVL